MKRILFFALLLSALFISTISTTLGSHIAGGSLTYTCLGGQQYQLTLRVYRDCVAAAQLPANVTINITSTCGNNTTTQLPQIQMQEISPLCPAQLPQSRCNGGALPGIQETIYQGNITLPSNCTSWTFNWTSGARNNSITNLIAPGSRNISISAFLHHAPGVCNNSPIFTTDPIPFICSGQPFNYSHGTQEPDGDSLAFQLVNPMHDMVNPAPFVFGNNTNYPFNTATGTFPFNTTTGQISITPQGNQNAVLAVQVSEFRNGLLVGRVVRDMQVFVISNCNNTPPSIGGGIANVSGGQLTSPTSIDVCAGVPVGFTVTGSDPDVANNLTLTDDVTTVIPGANINSNGNNPVVSNFNWLPTSADIGTHIFNMNYRDNGCPIASNQIFSISINVLSCPPNLDFTADNTSLCGNGTVVFNDATTNATQNMNLTWDFGLGANPPTAIGPGPHSVFYNNSGSKDVKMVASDIGFTDSIIKNSFINVHDLPSPTAITGAPDVCEFTTNEIYQITNNHGSNYTWTVPNGATITSGATGPNNNTITVDFGDQQGVITVEETDINGCVSDSLTQISISIGIDIDLGNDTAFCNSNLMLDAGNFGIATNYNWSELNGLSLPTIDNQILIVNQSGDYVVEANNVSCYDTDTIRVTILTDLGRPIDLGNDYETCNEDTILFSGNYGNSTYQWSNNDGVLTSDSSKLLIENTNNYWIIIDSAGCIGSDSINVVFHDTPKSIGSIIGEAILCENSTNTAYSINPVSNASNYSWSANSSTITSGNGTNQITIDLESISDTLSVILANHCGNGDTILLPIEVVPYPISSLSFSDTIICDESSINLVTYGGTSNSSYQWERNNQPIGNNSDNLSIGSSGEYKVTITNSPGCSSTSDISNVIVDNIEIDLEASSTNILRGENVLIEAITLSGNPNQYQWIPIPSNQSFINDAPETSTTYFVTATTINGCTAHDSVNIIVREPLVIPNAFSPNGDGLNDTWRIIGLETFKNARTQVFNRWGSIVFNHIGTNPEWSGRNLNGIHPTATYYYIIDLSNEIDGGIYTGSVTLVR